MSVLILNQQEVYSLLPMKECIEIMEQALRTLAAGKAVQPLRPVLRLPDGSGAMGIMPAYLDNPHAVGLKVITIFPGNRDLPYDSHQGAVLLFDAKYGRLLAILDASSITAIRTAAVSAVATRLLAREEARSLAILGSGVQAESHLEAMRAVREIREVRVWSPTRSNLEGFVRRVSHRFDMPVAAAESAREALAGADIICTVTSSSQPVLMGEWLTAGAHINAVGSSVPSARELDTSAVQKSLLYVDRRESALNEAGDFLIPLQEGAIQASHIRGEIGELLLGQTRGRSNSQEITLFKSLGLAVEDLAAAHHLYEKALGGKTGQRVELGGERHPPAR